MPESAADAGFNSSITWSRIPALKRSAQVCGKAARAALGNLGEHVSRDRAHVMATRTSTAPAKLDRPARLRQKERLEVWIQTEHQNRAGSEIHRFVIGTGLRSPPSTPPHPIC
jgi:hypothetical protein